MGTRSKSLQTVEQRYLVNFAHREGKYMERLESNFMEKQWEYISSAFLKLSFSMHKEHTHQFYNYN